MGLRAAGVISADVLVDKSIGEEGGAAVGAGKSKRALFSRWSTEMGCQLKESIRGRTGSIHRDVEGSCNTQSGDVVDE